MMLVDLEGARLPFSVFKGEVVILVGAGRDAAQEARRWGEALAASRKTLRVLGLALIGKLPFLVPKAVVRAFLQADPASPKYIDWDDQLSRRLGIAAVGSEPQVLVIDPGGVLRYHLAAGLSDAALAKVLERVDSLSAAR